MRVFQQVAVVAAACSAAILAGEIRSQAIRNFHQVNDIVYRGAQPSDEGFRELARRGIKTVIDLRRPDEHSTEMERQVVEAAGMRYVNAPMQGIVAPPEWQIANIVSLLDSDEPVLVHCKEGGDRTGVVMAAYRMSHDGFDQGCGLPTVAFLDDREMKFAAFRAALLEREHDRTRSN